MASQTHRQVWVNGPIIVGAGPSGLSVAASLKEKGVPYEILERADCIASLWQMRTYDRLKLHLPKKWCRELPSMPFHDDYPEHPTRRQYVDYLETCAAQFQIMPRFNTAVLSARHDETSGVWRVRACSADTGEDETEYFARWLVVATGEHAERVIPKDIQGFVKSGGEVTHVAEYNSGEPYRGKNVLVVGAGRGNSGVEVALDLCDHGARPAVVARLHHRLPRTVFGKPILELASVLLKDWKLPAWAADKAVAILARAVLGDHAKLGLRRPAAGQEGGSRIVRTPVFDCGDLEGIRAGDIAVVPAVARFGNGKQVEFIDGRAFNIDVVMLATGYRSNLPQATWHGRRNGYPAIAFPYGWDGYCGLYAVGFSRRNFGGASTDDAVQAANEIAGAWRAWSEGRPSPPAATATGWAPTSFFDSLQSVF
ncbi:unnamed protein product [Urochloa humidicola]